MRLSPSPPGGGFVLAPTKATMTEPADADRCYTDDAGQTVTPNRLLQVLRRARPQRVDDRAALVSTGAPQGTPLGLGESLGKYAANQPPILSERRCMDHPE